MTDKKEFEEWAAQVDMWGKHATDFAWAAWQAATKVERERNRLEMLGIIQTIATNANVLANFANNLNRQHNR